MSQQFQPGDFLVFQLESGFGLLRLLDISDKDGERVWHLAAYEDLFFDVELAEAAIKGDLRLTAKIPHAALTTRAFESTQVARLGNIALKDEETKTYIAWQAGSREVSDSSIRLMMGLR